MEVKKNIPQLRFPGFEGVWEEKQLSEIADFLDNKRIPLSESQRKLRQGDFPYYGASGIIDFIDDYIFEGEYVLLGEDGANILTRSTKLAFIVRGAFWVNNHAHVLKSHSNSFFLAESLERIRYDKYNTGTAQPKLNADVCKRIRLFTPSLPEQQKIASFLSTVDEKIAQLSQKQSLLEQYKKGMMQQLFSQALRFKKADGTDFEDWDVKELGEVFIKINEKNKGDSVTTVLTNSAVEGIVLQLDYFNHSVANTQNISGYFVVEKGDFVYNPRTSTPAPVGPLNRNRVLKGVMSPLYTVIRLKKGDPIFFEHYFKTAFWHLYMKSVANYGARHDRISVSLKDFLKMPLPFPCIEEQTRIATFLSAIDQKVNQVEQQLEKTKAFKKGLLQQMFV